MVAAADPTRSLCGSDLRATQGISDGECVMDHQAELRRITRRKNEAYRAGDLAGYLATFATDAIIFALSAMNVDDMRRSMAAIFDAGGKLLAYSTDDPERILLSQSGDAATLSYSWREKVRHPDGRVTDTSYHETNV